MTMLAVLFTVTLSMEFSQSGNDTEISVAIENVNETNSGAEEPVVDTTVHCAKVVHIEQSTFSKVSSAHRYRAFRLYLELLRPPQAA